MIDKIKSEIERLMHNRDSRLVDGSYFDFKELLSFIESLEKEQTDIDFEKEYKEHVEQDPVYSKLANGIVAKAIATHFYNLGKESRK